MRSIGGNTTATIQISTETINAIGESVSAWTDVQTLKGWLDLASGSTAYTTYLAKIQESTHLFICVFVHLDSRISAENARMKVNGHIYDITYIDNPMGMQSGSHLEIFLKYTGGQ